MSFDKLLESAKQLGNESFINDFEAAVASNNAVITSTSDRVKVLESELEGTISKKNKLRDMVKSNTGLEELSEEGFKNYLDSLKSKDADEALKADKENLSKMVGEYKSKLDETVSTYESELSNMKINLTILESGELNGIESSVAKELILKEIRNGATKGETGIVYKDENGGTVLKDDGTPLTISDKIEALKGNADYSPFFPDKRKKGGGKGVDSPMGDHGVKDLSKLTRSEKAQLMAEMSPEDYQALVRQNLKRGK